MKKKYTFFNLFNWNFFLIGMLFISNSITAQQNVYSRSDSGTNLWWNDSNFPWYYQSWNSIERRPDIWPIGTRNNVIIDHNNNTSMIINGLMFYLNTLTIQSTATTERFYNPSDGGGISLSVGYYKQSGSGNQTFNVPIGVDGNQVTFSVQSGNTTFSSNFYINSNVAVFEGNGNFNLTGIAQGDGGAITKNGSGTLTLSNTNTYTGLTTINDGVLQLSNQNGTTLPSTNDISINENGTLKISSNQTIDILNLNGGVIDIDEGVSLTVQNFNFTSGNIIGLGNLITTPNIVSQLAASVTVGYSFNYAINADYTPTSYAASGLLSGLSIDTVTGVISGTPTQAGVFNVEISAINAVGTSTETLVITVIPVTNLNLSSCNITGLTPYNWLRAIPIQGATDYRFNVYDETGTNFQFSFDRNVPFFRFFGNAFIYGTTYLVKVQVKQNGIYGAEGNGCLVTTESLPTTSLNASHCGSTVTPYQWMFAPAITGASEYRFNVYDETGTNLQFSVDRNVAYFRFYGSLFTYGTTYLVKIQAKQGAVYGAEGAACAITLESLPTTKLQNAYCGITVNPYQWMFANAVTGATSYRFNIYDGNSLVTSIDRTVPYFRFYGNTFAYGATYQVKIQVEQNGSYGVEGSACSVTLESLPTISLQTAYCGITVSPYQWMFANAVTGASEYRFNVYDETGTNLQFSVDRTVPYFRFYGSNFTAGMTYMVGIQVRQGEVYGNEGSRCLVSIEGPAITALESSQCGTSMLYTDLIYAISVSDATGYRFNVYNTAGTILIASYESTTNSFSFSQLTGYTFDTTYQIRVQITRGPEYGLEGAPCTVTILKENPAPTRAVVVAEPEQTKTTIITELKAYPNPFTSTFQITPIAEETATLFYQVYDVSGKMIESQSVEANNVEYHTIGEMYPVGMYLVIVRQGATTQTFKMIKQ